jgi:hypothetical protein
MWRLGGALNVLIAAQNCSRTAMPPSWYKKAGAMQQRALASMAAVLQHVTSGSLLKHLSTVRPVHIKARFLT